MILSIDLGMTGGCSALAISGMVVELELMPVVFLPQCLISFENRKRQMNAEGQLQLLRKNTRLLLIPNDMIASMASKDARLIG